MHVVRADFRLENRYFLPFAERPEDFPDFKPFLPIEDLSPEFRGEHYVVFAVPARMSQCLYIFHVNPLVSLLCSLSGRISIIIKGFLFSAPPEGFFRTTSLAGGFRSYKKTPSPKQGKR